MTFGAVYGVPIGARFRNRRSLYDARVHRDVNREICGSREGASGAESILLTGRCDEDLDLGEIVYYTGEGRRSSRGVLTSDQEFSGLNALLAENIDSGEPVRLIRWSSGEFEYGGLYIVEDAYLRLSKGGFKICQYRVRALGSLNSSGVLRDGRIGVERLLSTHYRLVRDRRVPSRIKAMYDYSCQICGIRIETFAGPYSEGAHIVPLGGESNGPDVDENVLSLCPNHHVMLDHGAIYFGDDWSVINRSGECVGKLRIAPEHLLDVSFAQKHRALMGFV